MSIKTIKHHTPTCCPHITTFFIHVCAVHSLVCTVQCAYRMAVFLYLKILVEKGGTRPDT